MGNAESNMLKGFIQVYLFATTKKSHLRLSSIDLSIDIVMANFM